MSVVMIENARRDKNRFFFLTRIDEVEISSFREVFNCANQCLLSCDKEVDEFGRNSLDRMFVRLCHAVYILLLAQEKRFKSLSCKKFGEQYVARLELSDEILEMGLADMTALIEQRCKS